MYFHCLEEKDEFHREWRHRARMGDRNAIGGSGRTHHQRNPRAITGKCQGVIQ